MPRSSFTLSSFQKEKLTYYFQFYEPNEQNCLDDKSLTKFMTRVLAYTKWDPNSPDARDMYQVHDAFFEIMFDKAAPRHGDDGKEHLVTLSDWLSVWEKLLPGCKGMCNMPVWLRMLPKSLFNMMDRDKDAVINEPELCDFYEHMVNLPAQQALKNSHLAFSQMTDNGRYPMNAEGYAQIFSNFLLGRTPYGPGRHIFGCFEHSVPTTPFTLIQPAPDSDDEEDRQMKIRVMNRPKRMSIAGL